MTAILPIQQSFIPTFVKVTSIVEKLSKSTQTERLPITTVMKQQALSILITAQQKEVLFRFSDSMFFKTKQDLKSKRETLEEVGDIVHMLARSVMFSQENTHSQDVISLSESILAHLQESDNQVLYESITQDYRFYDKVQESNAHVNFLKDILSILNNTTAISLPKAPEIVPYEPSSVPFFDDTGTFEIGLGLSELSNRQLDDYITDFLKELEQERLEEKQRQEYETYYLYLLDYFSSNSPDNSMHQKQLERLLYM